MWRVCIIMLSCAVFLTACFPATLGSPFNDVPTETVEVRGTTVDARVIADPEGWYDVMTHIPTWKPELDMLEVQHLSSDAAKAVVQRRCPTGTAADIITYVPVGVPSGYQARIVCR